jgi:hypothetical protein
LACWCWRVWCNAFDSRLWANFNIRIFTAYSGISFEFSGSFFSHHIAGFLIIKTWIVMA